MILILLDIDGTLVDSMAVENKYFPQAVCEGLGIKKIKTDWESFTNPTDSGIVREVMREEQGKLCHPEDIEKCRNRFIQLLQDHLAKDRKAFKPIAGALEFIAFLEKHEGYTFAVATGGWRISAELKLAAAQFEFEDWILYSCSDYEYKKEAMKAAHMTARHEHGSDFEAILYIGDSRSDMRFSNELGYEFLGVGEQYVRSNIWGVEGIHDFSDLRLVDGKIRRAVQVR